MQGCVMPRVFSLGSSGFEFPLPLQRFQPLTSLKLLRWLPRVHSKVHILLPGLEQFLHLPQRLAMLTEANGGLIGLHASRRVPGQLAPHHRIDPGKAQVVCERIAQPMDRKAARDARPTITELERLGQARHRAQRAHPGREHPSLGHVDPGVAQALPMLPQRIRHRGQHRNVPGRVLVAPDRNNSAMASWIMVLNTRNHDLTVPTAYPAASDRFTQDCTSSRPSASQ